MGAEGVKWMNSSNNISQANEQRFSVWVLLFGGSVSRLFFMLGG